MTATLRPAMTVRSELGDFLRSRRERISPDSAGLSARPRRRTPGLRREEVAELAGIGVDWYVRLEQGRAVSPSVATVDALAAALRLTREEHAHLTALTRNARPAAFVRESVPASLRRLIDGLHQPAYLTGRRSDLLAWNTAAADLFTDIGATALADRNILVYMLTTPAARALFGAAWRLEARRMVAQFRGVHDLFGDDPAFVQLSERLRRESPEFAEWWEAHDIRQGGAGQKLLHHPQRGGLRFEYASFHPSEHPGLKLTVYTSLAEPAQR